MAREKSTSSEPGADLSAPGTSDKGAHQELASPVTKTSGKRLSGRPDRARAVPEKSAKSRENMHKVPAPLSPTLLTTSGRVSNAQMPRHKSKANLSPSQPEEQQPTAAARPELPLPVTGKPRPSVSPTASPSSPCSDPLLPALSEETRGRHGSRALLLSARETSWVSAGKRGLSDTSNISGGRSTGLSMHGPCAKKNALGRKRALAAAACLLTFFLSAVVATVIVLALKTQTPHREEKQYCTTLDCQLHARLLTTHLNTSIDPCEDFSAYVCSGWSPKGDHREDMKTPIDKMAFSRIAGFDTILAEGTRKIPAGVKALQMHKSCMNDQNHGGLYLRQFQSLMQEMGLSWPEAPEEDINALEVLIALSYKWQVHLWIEVRVLALPQSSKWRLAINDAPVLPVLINQYNNVKDIGIYRTYWMGYFADLSSHTKTSANASDLMATIIECRKMEGAILNGLKRFVLSRRKSPTVFSLGNISKYSKPITSKTWMNALHKNVALSPPLSANHDVALNHKNFLETIGSLFRNFSEQKIISQCAWTFVQHYAPIAEPRMLLRRFGDRHKVKAYRPIFCGFHVEATYKVLLLSLDIAARIKDTDKVIIENGFQTLVSAAVRKLESSQWLDADSKKIAKEKFTSVKMQVWPNEVLMKNEEIEDIYKDYPSAEESFAAYWMHARRAIRYRNEKVRHLNDSQVYWDALGLPLNFAPSYPNYDYVTGTLALPIYLLDRPLYYTGGTNAMFFGGLGFLLALNLIKAIDEVGVRWLPNGTNVDSIFSKEPRKAFENKSSCLEPDGAAVVFPDIPALEMAYSALEVTDKTGNGSPDVQKGLPSVKAFFMTICYMTCALPRFKSAFTADCNKIARNSDVFATAFNCSPGSKMNPSKKCHFFG